MRKLTLEQFIEQAKKRHGSKFDYSKVIYKGLKGKIEVICPIHGSFWVRAGNHLFKKYSCNFCSPTGGAPLTREQYLKKVNLTHKNRYDYSKLIFNGVKEKVIVICKLHGEFSQSAESHFRYGCPTCAGNKPLTLEEFIKRANIIHNNKYDYSLIKTIKGMNNKVEIICPKHKIITQTVGNHLSGKNCRYCKFGNSSKKEQLWLDICGVPKDDFHRNAFIKIEDRKFFVDGLYAKEKVIYEFLGDYWHGNPSKFDGNKINRNSQESYLDLFNKTVNRIRLFRKNGYKVISIWESIFDKRIKCLKR